MTPSSPVLRAATTLPMPAARSHNATTNLFAHQFPLACNGRFLAVNDDLVGAGLGFTAILLARLLAVAVKERRVLIEVPSHQPSSSRWCTAPPRTLQCYYRAWTNCSLSHATDVRNVSLRAYHQSRKWYGQHKALAGGITTTPPPMQFLFRANHLVKRHADAVAARCGVGGYWTVHVRDSPEKRAELNKKKMPTFGAHMRKVPPSATRILWQTASPAAFAQMTAYAHANPTMRFCATSFSRHDNDVWGGRNSSMVDESGITGAVNGELGRRGQGLVSLKSSMWTRFLSSLNPSMPVVGV